MRARRLRPAEDTIEFGIGAANAGRGYSLALPLPLVAPFQPLAQFLGRLAFQRVFYQGAQARRPRGFVILGLTIGRKSSPAAGGRSPGRKYFRLSSRHSIRGTEIRTFRTPEAAGGIATMAIMLGIMPGTLFPTGRSVR